MSRIQNPCREIIRGRQMNLESWKKTRIISDLQGHAIYANTITPRLVGLINVAICREHSPMLPEIKEQLIRVETVADISGFDPQEKNYQAIEYWRKDALTFHIRWNLIWYDCGVFAHDCCRHYTDWMFGVSWSPQWQASMDAAYERCCDIFRDAIKWGPEFPRVNIPQHIRQIAQAIYDDKDFDSLGVLADAMEESGLFGSAILEDCRRKVRRHRGYWLTDFLLGKRG